MTGQEGDGGEQRNEVLMGRGMMERIMIMEKIVGCVTGET